MNEKFVSYLEMQIAACQKRQAQLKADQREDEAIFEKVKENVYDIFRTAHAAAVRSGAGDQAAVHRFFAQRMAQIPAAWQHSLEKAQQHGDVEKIHLENVKLEAVRDIEAAYHQLREEEI